MPFGNDDLQTSGYGLITSGSTSMEEMDRQRLAKIKRDEEIARRRNLLIESAKKLRKDSPRQIDYGRRQMDNTRRQIDYDKSSGIRPTDQVYVDGELIPLSKALEDVPKQMDFENRILSSPIRLRALRRARTEELQAEGMSLEEATAQAEKEQEGRAEAFRKGQQLVKKADKNQDKEFLSFASGYSTSIGAPLARAAGFDQAAQELEAHNAGVHAEMGSHRQETYGHPDIAGAIAGTTESAAQMLPGMAASMIAGPEAGMAFMALQYGSQEYSRAMYEGAEAGLAGDDLKRYAELQGVIEGSVMVVFNKIPGMKGIEGRVLREGIARKVASHPSVIKALKNGAVKLTQDSVAEVAEEVTTEMLHGYTTEQFTNEDVDYRAIVKDTVVQTLMMMGMVEGAQQAGRLATSGSQLSVARSGNLDAPPEQQATEIADEIATETLPPVAPNVTDATIDQRTPIERFAEKENPSRAEYNAAVEYGLAPRDNAKSKTGRAQYAAELRGQKEAVPPSETTVPIEPATVIQKAPPEDKPVDTQEAPPGTLPESWLEEATRQYYEGVQNEGQQRDQEQQQGEQRIEGRQGLLTETPSTTEGSVAAVPESPKESGTPSSKPIEPDSPPVERGNAVSLDDLEPNTSGMRKDSEEYWRGREIPQDKGDWYALPRVREYPDGGKTVSDGRHRIQEAIQQKKEDLIAVQETMNDAGDIVDRQFIRIQLPKQETPVTPESQTPPAVASTEQASPDQSVPKPAGPVVTQEEPATTQKPKPADNPGVVQTIAGKMDLDEFEQKGYAPEQITQEDWVNLQRANRRKLGQPEESGPVANPFSDYKNYHEDAVRRAVEKGDDVDPEVLKDYPDLARPPEQVAQPSPVRSGDQKYTDRFRKFADGMQKLIDTKRQPMTQNPTPKRMREYGSRRNEAEQLEYVQEAMRVLADAHESGTVPPVLLDVKTKADVTKLIRHEEDHTGGYYDPARVLPSYRDKSPAGLALQEMVSNSKQSPEQAQAKKEREERESVERLEEKVRFSPIPGFFPTPRPLVDRMVADADIQEGMSVLEPSAGKGDIADVIRSAGVEPSTVESHSTLADILRAKGYQVAGSDFLEHNGKYDRIVMNPPFEKGADIDHVRHAFDSLNPNGRVVAIMSEGPFFRNDKKSVSFREWLESVGGVSEKLDPKTFAGKDSFRKTGVATRIVTIDRPAETSVKKTEPAESPPQPEKVENPATPEQSKAQSEEPVIPAFTRTTPEKDSIARKDQEAHIGEVREKMNDIEQRVNKLQHDHDGLRRNATKKRADLKRQIRNLNERQRDLSSSIRRDELSLMMARTEDALESPTSYDHYLAGMKAINQARANLDDSSWQIEKKPHTENEREAVRFHNELMQRAVDEGKRQGLDEEDSKRAALTAINWFSAVDNRPLSHFVEQAANRIRESRIAMPMGKLFPPHSVYGGMQKTVLSNEERDSFAEQLREATKDDANATSKIKAIDKEIDKAIEGKKRQAEQAEKKKAETAAKEKAKAESEALKKARERAKRYFQEQRINKALKSAKPKTTSVVVRYDEETDRVRVVEGNRTEQDVKGELYPNGLILHPSFEDGSKDFAITHAASGLAFPFVGKKSDMNALINLTDMLGVDFGAISSDGEFSSDMRERMRTINTAWSKDNYAALNDQDRARVEELASVAQTDIQADLILSADDLGANGIPPGMDTVMTARGAKVVRDMAREVPEFAYDPVFTVQDGKLVFRDGFVFRFTPGVFNLHPSELTEGQTVGINLEDLGIKRATPQDVVADVLKNAGLPVVKKSKSGDVSAGYIGSLASVQQGESDTEWSISGGTKKVRDLVETALKKIRWRQPGQTGPAKTEITNESPEPAVSDSQAPEGAPSYLRSAADKAKQELRDLQILKQQYASQIMKEWQQVIQGEDERRWSGAPITPDMGRAMVGYMATSIQAGVKSFEVFIRELRANLAEDVIRGIGPNLIRAWNSLKDKAGLDEATTLALEAALDDTKNADIDQAVEAAIGETAQQEAPPETPPTEPAPVERPDGDRLFSTQNAASAETRSSLGMEERPPVDTLAREPSVEMAKAYSQTKAGSDYIDMLIQELSEQPRAVSPYENDLLNARNAELGNKLEAALKRQIEARKSGDNVQESVAATEATNHRVALQALIENVLEPMGTAAGRALQARKAWIDSLLTLSRHVLEYSAAYKKDPSKQQVAEWEQKFQELEADKQKLQKLLDAQVAKNEDLEASLKEAHDAAVKKVRTKPSDSAGSSRQEAAQAKINAAYSRIRKLLGGSTAFSAGGALTEMGSALTELAIAYSEMGVVKLSDFLSRVKKRMGPAFEQVREQATEAWKGVQDSKPAVDLSPITGKIDVNDPDSIGRAARDLHGYVIERDGLDASAAGREAAVDAVHAILSQFVPGITGAEVSRAMSGIGIYSELSKDAIEVIRRDQKAQLLLLEQIADWKKGEAPPATGQERPPISDEQRELRRAVNEAKKASGISTATEGQLRSALDAAKRMARNRIADLTKAIESGVRIAKSQKLLKPDAELESLQKERDELQKLYDEAFGKPELSDEQRLNQAEKALDRAITSLEADLKAGKLYPDAPKARLTSPSLEAKQATLDALKANRDELRLSSGEAQQRSDAEFERRLRERDAELARRLAEGDFKPKPKKPERAKTPEMLRLGLSIEKKTRALMDERKRWEFDNRHPVYKALVRGVVTPPAILRKTLTSFEQSLIGRQGWLLGITNPRIYAKSIRSAFPSNPLKAKSLFPTEQDLFNVQAALDADEDFVRLEKIAKLAVTDVHGGINREEENLFVPEWVNKLPGLGGSERAASAFINSLRRLVFRSLVDKVAPMADGKRPSLTAADLRVLGHLVNVSTGRGRVGIAKFDSALTAASVVFFSPRWWLSRLQWWTGQPMWHETRWFGGEGVSPGIRSLVVKEWSKQAAAQMAIIGLVTAALYAAFGPPGDDEEWDFGWQLTDPNFGKIRIGNTQFDLTAGLGQHLAFVSRIGFGTQAGRWETTEVDKWRLFTNYGRGKLAPVPSMFVDYLAGKSVGGEEFGSPGWIRDALVPLAMQDVWDARNEDPALAAGIAAAVFFGIGTQSYSERIKERNDTANELRAMQTQGKSQEQIDELLRKHFSHQASLEAKQALRTETENTDALQKVVDQEDSPELDAAIQKEKGDLALMASVMLSTEDRTQEKSAKTDDAITTARELLKATAPTFNEANELFTEAYHRRNGSTREYVGGQWRTKRNVIAARKRLMSLYQE